MFHRVASAPIMAFAPWGCVERAAKRSRLGVIPSFWMADIGAPTSPVRVTRAATKSVVEHSFGAITLENGLAVANLLILPCTLNEYEQKY